MCKEMPVHLPEAGKFSCQASGFVNIFRVFVCEGRYKKNSGQCIMVPTCWKIHFLCTPVVTTDLTTIM